MSDQQIHIKKEFLYKIFPYSGAIIIALSTFKAILYYALFQIKILSFLDFSECILLFLDDLIIILIATISALVIVYKFYEPHKNIFKTSVSEESKEELEFRVAKLKKMRTKMIWLCMLVLVIMFLLFLAKFSFLKALILMAILGTLIILPIVLVFYVFRNSFDKKRVTFSQNAVFLIAFCWAYFFEIIFITVAEAYTIKNSKNSRVVVNLRSKGMTDVTTSDSCVYIGKTRNYFFFYNPLNSTSMIYPVDQFEVIKFAKK